MPTVLTENGFKIRIYLNDHTPAHVHVIKDNNEAKVALSQAGSPVKLLNVTRSMSDHDVAAAMDLVASNNGLLLKRWKEIHT